MHNLSGTSADVPDIRYTLERMAEAHEPMPDWWDEHDRGLLVRCITEQCER